MVTTLEVRMALAMPIRRRFLRQIDSLKSAGSAGSYVREMNPRLKNDLWILTGIEGHG